MDDNSKVELAQLLSAFDDFNLTVIKTFLEVAKLLPADSRKPVADSLRELVEEHRAASQFLHAFMQARIDGVPDA